jgi:4-amino-4-deoxy-L-arabinose transferase-like glycosyltransferase
MRRLVLPALLVLACAVYFVALGNSAIWDANEAFYVETPREMLEGNDFVNPSFNYLPRFNKPVLSYWIVAVLYRLFGVSVGVQRFGIALGALLIIACAYVLAFAGSSSGNEADRIIPKRTSYLASRASAGMWAAVMLASAPRLVMFARRIFIDIWITAFLALTLTCFALSERYPERRRTYLVLMYISVGLGVLTKGPVAIALPLLAFTLYLAVTRQLRRITQMMIPLGALIVAAIAVPWYAALYNEHGWTYIKSFVIAENLERYTQGLGVQQHRGPWFYLPVVLSDSFPASVLLFAAAAVWKQRTRTETLLWCWIAAIVGFFSLSAGKQDLYIFPIVPAVAALAGVAVDRGLSNGARRTWLTATLAVTGALLALAGGAVVFLFNTAGRVYALDGALVVGAIGLAGGIVTLALGLMRRPAAAALTLVAAVIAVDWIAVVRVLPEFERYKPVPVFSRELQERLAPGDLVTHYQVALPSMVFYLRRHVDQYFEAAPFVATIMSGKTVYAVLSADDYASLASAVGSHTCVIDRRPTFEVKLRQVLKRQPLPELLLISNRCQ